MDELVGLMTASWIGVGLVLRGVLVPLGHALALRMVLRSRPEASVAEAADALATSIHARRRAAGPDRPGLTSYAGGP